MPIGFDVGIGALSPLSPKMNFRIGINTYFGKVWEQDAILSFHFSLAKFSGFNQWQSFSLGIGNNSSSGFYWRVGGFVTRYVDIDKSFDGPWPHFELGWNFIGF